MCTFITGVLCIIRSGVQPVDAERNQSSISMCPPGVHKRVQDGRVHSYSNDRTQLSGKGVGRMLVQGRWGLGVGQVFDGIPLSLIKLQS